MCCSCLFSGTLSPADQINKICTSNSVVRGFVWNR